MKAEDFIELIEQNRFDKISKNGMTLIAERFRELQSKQLTLTDVSQRSELLPDFLYKDDFGIKIGYHGDTEVSEEWNDYLKKLGNCG